MNRDETRTLLKTRSALTSQPYGDDAITAWHDVLQDWTLDQCRHALTTSARQHRNITAAHIVEQLPSPTPTPTPGPPLECELCDNTGWVDNPHHHARHCQRTNPCHCHGVTPCKCSRGQAMIETQRRILGANQ